MSFYAFLTHGFISIFYMALAITNRFYIRFQMMIIVNRLNIMVVLFLLLH